MHYLRENKRLLIAAMSLPLFFFYIDGVVVSFLKNYYVKKSSLYYLLEHADPFMNFISHGGTLITVGVVFYLYGRFSNKMDHRMNGLGKTLLVGFISSGIFVQILKHLVGRVRPRLTDDLVFVGPSLKKGYDSFPSGHATAAFCFAYILSSYFPRYRVFFYTWAVLIGLERVEGIAHFPSDVLTGAIVGTLIAKLLSSYMSKSAVLYSGPSEGAGEIAGTKALKSQREL